MRKFLFWPAIVVFAVAAGAFLWLTDTARIPSRPVWSMVREVAERTAAAWKAVGQKDLLPALMRKATDKQIHSAIANIG